MNIDISTYPYTNLVSKSCIHLLKYVIDLEPRVERNDNINPFWIEEKSLRKGPVAFLSVAEQQFWRDLIDKYLYPIDEDKDEKARIAADLIELRNKSVFSFFMINALFVLIVFLLQLNKDKLHLDWPIGVKTNITTIAETSEVNCTNIADVFFLKYLNTRRY